VDWSNERYVRWYTRDTKTWLLLGWQAQCVLGLLIRKVDRAGVLDDVRDGSDLAVVLGNGMPVEHIQFGLERLAKYRTVEITDTGLVLPNFLEAQEAAQSDKQRARESRERKRAKSRIVTTSSRNVTDESRNVTLESQAVTGCHNLSQPVTLAVPSVLSCAVPNQIPPNPPRGSAVRDPTKGKPVDRFRASFRTQCPDEMDFSEAHRALCRRGSIDIKLEWRSFSKEAQATGKHLSDWNSAFEGHLAKAVARIERAASFRANGATQTRSGDRSATLASTETKPTTEVNVVAANALRSKLAKIGGSG
jgi:hypothetical protein